MSIVLCYADRNKAIMASDGRMIDSKGNIINESFKKITRINHKILLGYAGDVGPCLSIANMIMSNPKEALKKFTFEETYNFILSKSKLIQSGIKYGFLLAGISNNGNITIAEITPYQLPSIEEITNNDARYKALYPDEAKSKGNIFAAFLLSQDPESAINSTIEYCSKISNSVNRQVFLDQVLL